MGSICVKASKIFKVGWVDQKLYFSKNMSRINEIRILKCRRSMALDVYRISIHVQCYIGDCLQFNPFVCNIIDIHKSIFLDLHFNILRRLYHDKCNLHNGSEWMGNGSKWIYWSCSPYWAQCWLCCALSFSFFVRLRGIVNKIKLNLSWIIISRYYIERIRRNFT